MTNPYETHVDDYDAWFYENDQLFSAEVEAIRELLPPFQRGVEIGAGSGLFAQALGIAEGVEPSAAMRVRALARGVQTVNGVAEQCPFPDDTFDLALMVTVDCYILNLHAAFCECHRILKTGGHLIIAFIDKETELGRVYEGKKQFSPFYKNAHFHSSDEIRSELTQAGFYFEDARQSVFTLNNEKQDILPGTGQGVFAVLKACKSRPTPER